MDTELAIVEAQGGFFVLLAVHRTLGLDERGDETVELDFEAVLVLGSALV